MSEKKEENKFEKAEKRERKLTPGKVSKTNTEKGPILEPLFDLLLLLLLLPVKVLSLGIDPELPKESASNISV